MARRRRGRRGRRGRRHRHMKRHARRHMRRGRRHRGIRGRKGRGIKEFFHEHIKPHLKKMGLSAFKHVSHHVKRFLGHPKHQKEASAEGGSGLSRVYSAKGRGLIPTQKKIQRLKRKIHDKQYCLKYYLKP